MRIIQVLAIGAIVACMLGTVIGGDSNVKYVPPTIYKVGNFMTISHKGFVKPHLSLFHNPPPVKILKIHHHHEVVEPLWPEHEGWW